MSSEKSYSLDDKSDNDGSDSKSSGTCTFPFHFDDSVGGVSGMGSVVFVPIVVESNCGVVALVVFTSIGVESKGG